LKRAIIAGLIAGFASGIVMFIFHISGWWDLLSIYPLHEPIDMHIILIFNIIQNTIWGVLFGIFFAMIYDHVPAIGVKKGLVYGLIIWIISLIRIPVIIAMHGAYTWAIPWIIVGFFSIAITYGLLIGYLYKK